MPEPSQIGADTARAKLNSPLNLPRNAQSRSRLLGLLITLLAAILARIYVGLVLGIRFDAKSLNNFLQFIDPELLRTHLWQSLYYLREQPPLFNLFLGLVLKIAPQNFAFLFSLCFLVMGLAAITIFYWLLTALRVPVLLATAISLLYAIHPATILYENWLFYEYPLMTLFILAAAFLHAYLSSFKQPHLALFFFMLTLIVWTRGTFPAPWMLLIVVAVAALPGMRWKAVIRCGLPFLLLAIIPAAKNYAVYGDLLTGETYRKFNYSVMHTRGLSDAQRINLVDRGLISPIGTMKFYAHPITDYADFLPPIKDTGIPLLDMPVKSTGASNWHYHAWGQVADLYYRDALTINKLYPGLYWKSVGANFSHCFRPTSDCLPFNVPGNANTAALRPWITGFNRTLAGKFGKSGPGWLTGLALLLVLPYWIIRLGCSIPLLIPLPLPGLKTRPRVATSQIQTARLATLGFCLFNFIYVCSTTIAMSYDDQNRYRFSVMPLFLILAASMATEVIFRPKQKIPGVEGA